MESDLLSDEAPQCPVDAVHWCASRDWTRKRQRSIKANKAPDPERSAAWLAHLLGVQEVAGSSPVAPTIFFIFYEKPHEAILDLGV